jgi:hypothetical protein
MDWLNWAIRIATVLGGLVFLVCFYFGAHSLITAWRSTLILWEAKRKWLALQRDEADKRKRTKKQLDDEDDEEEAG